MLDIELPSQNAISLFPLPYKNVQSSESDHGIQHGVEHAQIPFSESAHGIEHGDTLLLLVGLPVHARQRLQPAEDL